MTDINFSVANEILTPLTSFKGNEMFKQDFHHFKDHMNKKIREILHEHKYSLKSMVEILMEDAVSSIESHNFLEGMAKFK
jgi:hypothetical protein